MDQEGFGSSGVAYEYVVSNQSCRKNRIARVLLVNGYVLYVAVILGVGAAVRLIAPLMCLIPLSLWVLVYFTWRYTQVEYKLSFLSGELRVTRLLNGKAPKLIVAERIRELRSVLRFYEEDRKKIPQKDLLLEAYDGTVGDLYAVQLSSGRVMILQLTEKAIKIIKTYNASCRL